MAGLAPLIGEVLGVERAPIEVVEDGLSHSVRIGDAIDFEVEDIVPFGVETGEPAKLTGIFHPVASELTAAEAKRSKYQCLWDRIRRENGALHQRSPGPPEHVTATAHERALDQAGWRPAYAAVRTRLGLIALLLALAAVGWWWTAREMRDMDGGPWTELGTVAWFLGVWVVMMAAMMFPSVAPTVALYSKLTDTRASGAPLPFASGYLLVWSAVGLLAYASQGSAEQLFGDALAWDSAGRWVAGGTLLVAATYELTPLKDVCLGKCRTPLGFLLGNWRDGLSGACRWELERRLVRRLLLGIDGVAVCTRRDERRLDGARRRSHRFREADPVASRGDVRNSGSSPRSRGAHVRGSGRHPGTDDSGSGIHVADEPNEPLGHRSRTRAAPRIRPDHGDHRTWGSASQQARS